MPPQSRGRAPPTPARSTTYPPPSTADESTPRASLDRSVPSSTSSANGDNEKDSQTHDEEEDTESLGLEDQDYTLDPTTSSTSSDSDPNDDDDDSTSSPPFLHHSNSSFLSANAFAPPYYNRPPTPLPASPSLTSLLRPSFSTTTSRPTTPDSSENDTEGVVAKSASVATTVPRASPKVPTYEYYGFVLYLLSGGCFCRFLPNSSFLLV